MTQVEYFFPVFRKSNCVIVIFLSAGEVWRPPVRPPAAGTSGHNSDVSICEPGYERVKQRFLLLPILLRCNNRQRSRVTNCIDVHTSEVSKRLKVVLLHLWRVNYHSDSWIYLPRLGGFLHSLIRAIIP